MVLGRVVVRGVGGLVALGVALVVLIPVVSIVAIMSIPVLVLLAVAGVVGSAGMLSVGLPRIIVALLAIVAAVAAAALLGGLIILGVFALKVMLFGLLIVWLARRLFGWKGSRPDSAQLVGLPVADIAAPLAPRRDKYDIAAERELDEELGL